MKIINVLLHLGQKRVFDFIHSNTKSLRQDLRKLIDYVIKFLKQN